MQKIHLQTCVLFLFLFVSFPFHSGAQTGWQWGVRSVSADTAAGHAIDVNAAAIDRSGNIYSGMFFQYPDTVGFGAITVATTTSGEMVITKTDPSGNFLWAIPAPNSNVFYLSFATDDGGNLYAYGYNYSSSLTIDTLTLSTPGGSAFLIKLSPSGHALWGQRVGGSSGAVGIDAGNNVYIAGGFNSTMTIGPVTLTAAGAGVANVFLAKFDPSGNLLWAHNFGGVADAFFGNMAVTKSGSLYISGSFSGMAPTYGITIGSTTLSPTLVSGPYYMGNFLARFDSSGHDAWAHSIPNAYGLGCLCAGPADGLYAAGRLDSSTIIGTDTLVNRGTQDMFLASFDSSGGISWARSGGSTFAEIAINVTTSCSGDVLVAGNFGGTLGHPPLPYSAYFGSDSIVLTTAGPDPVFIARYNASGDFVTGTSIPSGGDDWLYLFTDTSGSFYAAGDYYGTPMIFAHDTLPGTPLESFFVSKYRFDAGCPSTTLVPPARAEDLEINLYPNPSSETCTIGTSETFPQDAHAAIYDLSGRLTRTIALTGNATTFSVKGISDGLYQCVIYRGTEKMATRKLIILNH